MVGRVRIPVFAIYLDGRKLATYTVLAFILGGVLGGVMWNFGGVYIPKLAAITSNGLSPLLQFSSHEELNSFLSTRESVYIYFDLEGKASTLDEGITDPDTVIEEKFSALAVTSAADSAHFMAGRPYGNDFSSTNIQVEGVDEADLVKTDGEYIYLARGDEVIIVKAYPVENAGLVKRIELSKKVIELYVNGDKLVVFLKMSEGIYEELMGTIPPSNFNSTTTIQVYDVSNKASPVLEREVEVDGSYFNSRMIGDYVYVIVRKGVKMIDGEVVLPRIQSEGQYFRIDPTDIYYVNDTDSSYRFTHILAINAQDAGEDVTAETVLLGRASNLYVSLGNIYITTSNQLVRAPLSRSHVDTTAIHKLSIAEGVVSYVAKGEVSGYVLNQFSMDEYEGDFRIATTSWLDGKSSNVYVLGDNMTIKGRLEELAPREDIYSARFMGDRCYLVTFKRVDPLFAIDLSDPSDPRVLGKLKIPGFSDYLHPYDENHLIGLGKETVESEDGEFAWHQGIKISLFDVSDVTQPVEKAKIVIGDRGSDSPARYDHRAFLFSRARNLLVIPILVYEVGWWPNVSPEIYGEYKLQAAYIFDISPEDGISIRGRITHTDYSEDSARAQRGNFIEPSYVVIRSLYIEDVLYTLSNNLIKMNLLDDLKELGTVDLS